MLKTRFPELLAAKRLSIAQFCKRSGVSYSTALGLSNGDKSSIQLEAIDEICRALRCEVGQLFYHDPPLNVSPYAGPGEASTVHLVRAFQHAVRSELVELLKLRDEVDA